MGLLIINTLQEAVPAAKKAVRHLTAQEPQSKIIHTAEMRIKPCVGCNACWLKTPGVCAIKDGYEEILKAYLEYDTTIFFSGTAFGFIDHRAKNIIDRMLPLVTMYTFFANGQMRHIPRYDRRYRFGLIYFGAANREYLQKWMDRFSLNFNGTSLGAFPAEQCREVSLCI